MLELSEYIPQETLQTLTNSQSSLPIQNQEPVSPTNYRLETVQPRLAWGGRGSNDGTWIRRVPHTSGEQIPPPNTEGNVGGHHGDDSRSGSRGRNDDEHSRIPKRPNPQRGDNN